MPAFDESERQRVLGVYTGCPCKVLFDAEWAGESPRRVHPEYVEALKKRCERYDQRDTTIHSNWNSALKMPYGEWQYYGCSHDVQACRFSLKEEKAGVTFRKVYDI